MDSQDTARISHKAKRETEAFINNYINDRAKGWPILCPYGSVNTGYSQKKDFRKPDILKIRLTG
jgi:hypothetical protein